MLQYFIVLLIFIYRKMFVIFWMCVPCFFRLEFFQDVSQLCVGYDYVYYHKKESGMCHRI